MLREQVCSRLRAMKESLHLRQQRVDGPGLNLVRRLPREPLVAGMFGDGDCHVVLEPCEKDDERLVVQFAIALAADLIVAT